VLKRPTISSKAWLKSAKSDVDADAEPAKKEAAAS